MVKSTVYINGKAYDADSGLPIDQEIRQFVETAAPRQAAKRSKQERLAAAVAHEFDGDSLDVSPETVDEIIEEKVADEQIAAAPSWIANYVEGGAPVEIEPIGLEKAAKDNAATVVTPIAASAEPEHFAAPVVAPEHFAAAPAHRHVQHSQTLNRHFVKKPAEPSRVGVTHAQAAPVATHPLVHKFDTYAVPVQSKTADVPKPAAETKEAPFKPVLTRAREEQLEQLAMPEVAAPVADSHMLKDVLINEQLSAPVDANLTRKERKAAAKAARQAARATRRRFRAPTLITAALAVLLLGGYVTYANMPSISVRVAAARAGVDAKNPYMPNGYSINGPVAYMPGQVTINYKSNSGGTGYSFTQSSTGWNSDGVRDNLVKPASDDYETLVVGDLTIYRYGNNAAWVQNGVLYTLDGNDRLGDNQILEIADSI